MKLKTLALILVFSTPSFGSQDLLPTLGSLDLQKPSVSRKKSKKQIKNAKTYIRHLYPENLFGLFFANKSKHFSLIKKRMPLLLLILSGSSLYLKRKKIGKFLMKKSLEKMFKILREQESQSPLGNNQVSFWPSIQEQRTKQDIFQFYSLQIEDILVNMEELWLLNEKEVELKNSAQALLEFCQKALESNKAIAEKDFEKTSQETGVEIQSEDSKLQYKLKSFTTLTIARLRNLRNSKPDKSETIKNKVEEIENFLMQNYEINEDDVNKTIAAKKKLDQAIQVLLNNVNAKITDLEEALNEAKRNSKVSDEKSKKEMGKKIGKNLTELDKQSEDFKGLFASLGSNDRTKEKFKEKAELISNRMDELINARQKKKNKKKAHSQEGNSETQGQKTNENQKKGQDGLLNVLEKIRENFRLSQAVSLDSVPEKTRVSSSVEERD